jgi:hypothetical protein
MAYSLNFSRQALKELEKINEPFIPTLNRLFLALPKIPGHPATKN